MKYIEINKKFTEKVAKYLANGYIINTATMNGSQGEVSHVDLTNGTEIIRVVLVRDYETVGCVSYNRLSLVVGRVDDEDIPANSSSDWHTVWNNRLVEVERENFYELYCTRCERVYGTLVEAAAIHMKQMARWRRKRTRNEQIDITSDKTRKLVTPVIKRRLCAKRVNKQNIQVKKCGNRYKVIYGNRSFFLA